MRRRQISRGRSGPSNQVSAAKISAACRDVIRVIGEAATRGQPPKTRQWTDCLSEVERLEQQGIRFCVCDNSQMNKGIHQFLNARGSTIRPRGVRKLLEKTRTLRYLVRHFDQLEREREQRISATPKS